jgi:hypothetical protein
MAALIIFRSGLAALSGYFMEPRDCVSACQTLCTSNIDVLETLSNEIAIKRLIPLIA